MTAGEKPRCADCKHYGDFGGRPPGVPPWPICQWKLTPETCGSRFAKRLRARFSWEATDDRPGGLRCSDDPPESVR